ncbi:MAG: ferrochelatase [Spirochaetota bacterium]
MATAEKKVLLINLGGPRDASEIPKFLDDLFSDPLVFDLPLPEFLRIRLAKFIAKKRAPKVAETYASLNYGGGSPLVDETKKQANALAEELTRRSGDTWQGKIAMACGYPDLRELPAEDLQPSKDNVIVPLFPHYSRSTTLSVAALIQKNTGESPMDKVGWVGPFYYEGSYIEACEGIIMDYFRGTLKKEDVAAFEPTNGIEDWQNLTIVYSAHGIPLRLIEKGDTYQKEILAHSQILSERLRNKGFLGETYVSYQSKVGPAKWTTPSTIEMLQRLGKDGHKRIAVFPISFVSDHLETLEEIGEELQEIAKENGVKEYYRIPAFGVYPKFIRSLANLVLQESKGKK